MIRRSVIFFIYLLCVIVAVTTQSAQADPTQWEKDIAAFEKMDREKPPPKGAILFVGSSSIRMWKSLERDFAPLPVINRGFGGSQIEDSIYYANRIIIPCKPSIVVLYAGDNDIAAGKTPDQVLEDFKRFAETVSAALPNTLVFYISIKPSGARWSMWEDMKKANYLVDRYITRREKLGYFDITPPMLDENGQIRGDIFLDDRLHLNDKGYRYWTSIVKPRLIANYDL